ncbi:hypothetical protein JG687_00002428 [Phytophthora cactorum]|uniref:EF-hand domain-containing protein n=1 Tax=Phytophthora cactorum TaxID=29920 RepID=A0A8T1UVE4_9STRA|nr:hypothetical protein JG687_00002428 [Phytophthora cactorum]
MRAKETLQLRHQLSASGLSLRAATYDTRRHHVLTFDSHPLRPHVLRLFSLRRELKSVPLFDEAKRGKSSNSSPTGATQGSKRPSFFELQLQQQEQQKRLGQSDVEVVVPSVLLQYSPTLDVFVCVYNTATRPKGGTKVPKTTTHYVVLLEPATLRRLLVYQGPETHTLQCALFDPLTDRLVLASHLKSCDQDGGMLPKAPNNVVEILQLSKRLHVEDHQTSWSAEFDEEQPQPSMLLLIENTRASLRHPDTLTSICGSRGLRELYGAASDYSDSTDTSSVMLVWRQNWPNGCRLVLVRRVMIQYWITAMAVSPCGDWLLAGIYKGGLRVWNVNGSRTNGSELFTIDADSYEPTGSSVADAQAEVISSIEITTTSAPVGEWKHQNAQFRAVERILFVHPQRDMAIEENLVEKLRLLLSCFVFYDHERVGVMAVSDFESLLFKLRYLWTEENAAMDDDAFDNAISATKKRFLDLNHDGQLCYLDFWVMLYIVGVKTRALISLHKIPSFCLLPKGLRIGKSSMDQKAERQHRRRVGGEFKSGYTNTYIQFPEVHPVRRRVGVNEMTSRQIVGAIPVEEASSEEGSVIYEDSVIEQEEQVQEEDPPPRLDEDAERALYGERIVNVLGEGIAFSPETEAAMKKKWQEFFDDSESKMFTTMRNDLEKKQTEQREAEERQIKLRKKWQEQRDQDLMRLQHSRQSSTVLTSMKQDSTDGAGDAGFRLRRIHRESCRQLTEELQFGVSVQRELKEARESQFFHFYYLPEGHDSIITLKMHVLRGDAEVFMSTDTKVPCSTDFMWRSSERLAKDSGEGHRIILYPHDLLKATSNAASKEKAPTMDPQELKSFQRLLETLSEKKGFGSPQAASFLLAGPSEEHLEFVQDEDQRLQEMHHALLYKASDKSFVEWLQRGCSKNSPLFDTNPVQEVNWKRHLFLKPDAARLPRKNPLVEPTKE